MVEDSGSKNSVTNVDKFHDWLRNTKAGQSVYAEAQKICDQRLAKDMSYDKVYAKSIEAGMEKTVEYAKNILLMLCGLAVFGIFAGITLLVLFRIITG